VGGSAKPAPSSAASSAQSELALPAQLAVFSAGGGKAADLGVASVDEDDHVVVSVDAGFPLRDCCVFCLRFGL
jgi:hypothetical protein